MQPAPPPTPQEFWTNSRVLILLASSPIGLLLSILSRADPGGPWWIFAQFTNGIAALGIAGAVVFVLLAFARRRIGGPFLGFAMMEAGLAAGLLWLAINIFKSPW
jgi:hypothetical protein